MQMRTQPASSLAENRSHSKIKAGRTVTKSLNPSPITPQKERKNPGFHPQKTKNKTPDRISQEPKKNKKIDMTSKI
jgi:hypothetical protein